MNSKYFLQIVDPDDAGGDGIVIAGSEVGGHVGDHAADDAVFEDNIISQNTSFMDSSLNLDIAIVPSTPSSNSPVDEQAKNVFLEAFTSVALGRAEISQIIDDIKVCNKPTIII